VPGEYIYEIELDDESGLARRVSAGELNVIDRGTGVRLGVPFPSPFRAAGPPATLEIFVPEAAAGSRLTLDIIDVMGRRVHRIADEPAVSGTTRLQWTGETLRGPLRAGLYFLRLNIPGRETVTRRFLVVS